MSELKPCPFCGGTAKLSVYYDFYRVHCNNDDCIAGLSVTDVYEGHGRWYKNISEARTVWNTRADDYRQAAEYWQRMYEEAFAERTCQIIGFDDGVDEGIDGEWHQYAEPQYDLSCGHSSQGTEAPNYCPNCGRKVVSE